MKKLFLALIAFSIFLGHASFQAFGSSPIGGDCTFKGNRLYGRVQIVSSFPDIKVQVVSSFPDLKVQAVNSFPDRCGKWQFVNSFPDFKIQYVNTFPDIKIMMVNSFPGVN